MEKFVNNTLESCWRRLGRRGTQDTLAKLPKLTTKWKWEVHPRIASVRETFWLRLTVDCAAEPQQKFADDVNYFRIQIVKRNCVRQ